MWILCKETDGLDKKMQPSWQADSQAWGRSLGTDHTIDESFQAVGRARGTAHHAFTTSVLDPTG